jgi:hypothetical protein
MLKHMEENEALRSPMSDKEKVDCLCQLYKIQFERFKHTRDIWFKIMLTLWTFMVVAGYYVKKEIHLCSFCDYYIFIVTYLVTGVFIWLIYYQSYRKKLKMSQVIDKGIGIQYRKKLNEIIGITLTAPTNAKNKDLDDPYPEENDNWHFAELWITIFIYACVFFYILLL